MLSHPELLRHCETVTDRIRSILQANHVFIQRYLSVTGKWQSLPSLAELAEHDSQVYLAAEEPEVSGDLTLTVGEQLRNLETVSFKIVTKIDPVTVRGDCLLLPIAHTNILWGRICIIGNGKTWQGRDLEWLKAIAAMLGETIAHLQPTPPLQIDNQDAIAILHRQIAELAASEQAKDEFISKISHDLRAPLMNMRMALKMLQINASQNPSAAAIFNGERIGNYFRILNSECEREISLIDNVLDLQKLETGNAQLQLVAIELVEWLPQLTRVFESRTQSQQQQLHLGLPETPALIDTDENYLSRILTELLHNACKYTASGQQIRCEVEYPPTPRQPVYLIVSNQAEIAEADLPHLFDRFYRVPAADHHKQGGTGLGLSLVRNLVEQLHGQITVQSSNGWTTFTVALPLDLSERLDQGAPSDAQLVAEL
jgi:signal transduction histidine kinase